jgi:hypothetical protein
VTPSLYYPRVVYTDSLTRIRRFFQHPDVQAFLTQHKTYPEPPVATFYFQDYRSPLPEPQGAFDLLISLNAGLISQACHGYLTPGGHLLANDAHYDARTAHLHPSFELLSVYDPATQTFRSDTPAYTHAFTTTNGKRMTQAMLQVSLTKPPSKDPHKLKHPAPYYLFQHHPPPT